jgi:enoyl-[acyl-carrier protein] reductase II
MIDAEKKGATNAELHKIIGNEFNRNREASIEGNLSEGTFQAGQSSGIVKDIVPVKELIARLIDEYEKTLESLEHF